MASQRSVQMTAGSSAHPVSGGHTRSILVLTRTMKSLMCDVCLQKLHRQCLIVGPFYTN